MRKVHFPETGFPDHSSIFREAAACSSGATAPVYAFAKSGFTEACREMSARNPAIRLVDFAQMVSGA